MSALAKMIDRSLAGMQVYVLDTAVPLVNIPESAWSGTLGCSRVCTKALKLIGNALIGSPLRRKASTCLNKELSTLVEEEDTFKDAAPFLFGISFQQKMNEHMEATRNLKPPLKSYGRNQSFWRSHPSQSQGGGSSRGRSQKKHKTVKHWHP